MKVTFYPEALKELFEMGLYDKQTFKRVEKIIKDIQRTPFEGIGKPEPLKHNFSGLWSRRVDDKNRIIYEVLEESIHILPCKRYYDDK